MLYTFTLRYSLPPPICDASDLVERLGDAGITDTLIGVGQPGRLAVEFQRDAASAREAVLSALRDVMSVLPTAALFEACPDYVGLSDVAELVGMSRQNLRKLMLGHAHTFPLPVHQGSTAIWHLDEVLGWMADRSGYAIDGALRDIAAVMREVNVARGLRGQSVERVRALERWMG